jgi:hypothetical protein
MTKTAVKEAQPDLLGAGATVKQKQAVAKVEPDKPRKAAAIAIIPKASATSTLAVIADALKDPNFKPENMRLVLDMHKEMIAEQARLNFTASMRELKRKLPTVNRDGKIEYKDKGAGKAKIMFASFENIHDIIRPLLDEHGFDLWYSSEPGSPGMINVIGNLDHEDGHVRRTIFPMPHDASGGKSGAQGWASAFSFGKRIATIGLLNIVTRAKVDQDRDGAAPTQAKGGAPVDDSDLASQDEDTPKITTEQHDKLIDALEGCGVSRKKFCEVYKITAIVDLPAVSFAQAMQDCADYKAKHKDK